MVKVIGVRIYGKGAAVFSLSGSTLEVARANTEGKHHIFKSGS